MAKPERKSARDLKILQILPENSAKVIGWRREHCWGYISIYENTPKNLLQFYLVLQGRMQLEHSSHIVKVGVKATC